MKNPLETIFNLEPDSTMSIFNQSEGPREEIEVMNDITGEVVQLTPEMSEELKERAEAVEDIQLQGQYELIYRAALKTFEAQTEIAQSVDPRFAARNAEVAAQYLNIALNATKDRTDAKFKRAKIKIAKDTAKKPENVQNTLNIFTNRNALLSAIKEASNRDKEILKTAAEEGSIDDVTVEIKEDKSGSAS